MTKTISTLILIPLNPRQLAKISLPWWPGPRYSRSSPSQCLSFFSSLHFNESMTFFFERERFSLIFLGIAPWYSFSFVAENLLFFFSRKLAKERRGRIHLLSSSQTMFVKIALPKHATVSAFRSLERITRIAALAARHRQIPRGEARKNQFPFSRNSRGVCTSPWPSPSCSLSFYLIICWIRQFFFFFLL